jgi:hypothetical protein
MVPAAILLQTTNRDRVTQIDDALVLLGVPEMIEEARRTIDLLAVAQRLEDTPSSSDGAGGTVLWWLEQPTERGPVVMGVMVTFGDPAYVAWQVAANPVGMPRCGPMTRRPLGRPSTRQWPISGARQGLRNHTGSSNQG